MKNTKYWEARQKQLLEALERDEEKLLRKLNAYYKRKMVDLEKEVSHFMDMFGEENIVQYNELLRTLDDEYRTMLIRHMEEFFDAYPELAHLAPIRENIYKLNRLEGLQKSILLQQMEMGIEENKILEAHLAKVYEKGSKSVLEFLGLGDTLSGFNQELLRRTINANWTGQGNYSQNIWKNREKLASYIAEDLRTAFARGDNSKTILKHMREKFPDAATRYIKRIIRTEGTYVFNEAQAQGWQDVGFEEYIYSAVLDNRTSDICENLNGMTFKWEERKAGLNFPPMHPNCRSSFTLPEMSQDEMMRQLRERNPGRFKDN